MGFDEKRSVIGGVSIRESKKHATFTTRWQNPPIVFLGPHGILINPPLPKLGKSLFSTPRPGRPGVLFDPKFVEPKFAGLEDIDLGVLKLKGLQSLSLGRPGASPGGWGGLEWSTGGWWLVVVGDW